MFKFLVASALLATAFAATPVNQCSTGLPLTDEVNFNGCTAEPCLIEQGSTAGMNVTFTAASDLETLHLEVVAFALGIETPYPLPDSDICQLLVDTQCPVVAGEQVTFATGMEILNIFPQIPVQLEFTVRDAPEGEGIVCFHVNTEIV